MEPPSPYRTIDTKKLAKRHFKFDSNKLDDLAKYLGVGSKLRTEKGLWKDCIEGDERAWKLMKEYNKVDVDLLEKVYRKMRGWDTSNVVNMNFILGTSTHCKKCGGYHLNKRGLGYDGQTIYQRYQCMNCGNWIRGEKERTDKVYK